MDAKIERRLTAKEEKTIRDIEERASKRKHKAHYTPQFIVDYMLESFKDWDYDEKEDAEDMLDAILVVAKRCTKMTKNQMEHERKYIIKEYIKGQFGDEE